MKRTVGGEALTQLVLETFRLNGRLLAAGERLTRPSGQSSARWQVMGALEGGPLTVAEVARRMGLSRQSVQRTADLLAVAGLAEFVSNPSHRRAKLVALSAHGRSILSRINQLQVPWSNQLAEGVGDGDLQTTLRVLRELRRRLEEPRTPSARTHSQGDHS